MYVVPPPSFPLVAATHITPTQLINGSTVYSPSLVPGSNLTSAAGEPLSFVLNATGQYVTSGKASARITQPDVLLPNGVVHVVDAVLVNTATDAAAASSA